MHLELSNRIWDHQHLNLELTDPDLEPTFDLGLTDPDLEPTFEFGAHIPDLGVPTFELGALCPVFGSTHIWIWSSQIRIQGPNSKFDHLWLGECSLLVVAEANLLKYSGVNIFPGKLFSPVFE